MNEKRFSYTWFESYNKEIKIVCHDFVFKIIETRDIHFFKSQNNLFKVLIKTYYNNMMIIWK